MTTPTGGLRWGILATGGIAGAFARALREADLNLVAVGSRSQASADAFAERFAIPRAHGSYESLAADPEVDIIYVSTPHPLHHAGARLALENGKHALVEKPFTLNRSEAEDLRRLAADRGLLVTEAMWTRYLPHMVRAREIVASGVLGEVRAVTADHTQHLSEDPAHRLNSLELGGGALLDLGIYPISFAWDLLGAPESVTAIGRLGETGADTEVVTAMRHRDGALSMSLSSSRAAGPNSAKVLGTLARIEIDAPWLAPTTMRVIATDGEVIEEFDGRLDAPDGRHLQAEAAERAVARGDLEGEVMPIAESVEIMGCLDEIRRQIGVRYPSE